MFYEPESNNSSQQFATSNSVYIHQSCTLTVHTHNIYHNIIISHFYKSLLKRIVCITLDLIPIIEMDIIKQYNLFMLLCLKVKNLFDHLFSFNLLKNIAHIKLEFTPKELSIFMKLFML